MADWVIWALVRPPPITAMLVWRFCLIFVMREGGRMLGVDLEKAWVTVSCVSRL